MTTAERTRIENTAAKLAARYNVQDLRDDQMDATDEISEYIVELELVDHIEYAEISDVVYDVVAAVASGGFCRR